MTITDILRALVTGDGAKLRDSAWQEEALKVLAEPGATGQPDTPQAPPHEQPAGDQAGILEELARLRTENEQLRAAQSGGPG